MSRCLYALLVGINNYPDPRHRLGGCINDMEGWQSYLESYAQNARYEFRPLILRDEAATRQAIIAGFTDHLTQAQQSDIAVFFFAGHGSQIPGQKVFNQMPNERNQTLVCWDSRSGSWDLVDKELSNLVADVAVRQPQITLIVDCCHSGSASRDESLKEQGKEFRKRQIDPQSVLNRSEDSYFSAVSTSIVKQATNREFACKTSDIRDNIFQLRQGHHILFSACHEVETAKEIRIEGGGARGVFSYHLQKILAEATREMNYAELLTQVRYELKKQNIPAQVPQLEVIEGSDADFQRFFLSQEIQPNLVVGSSQVQVTGKAIDIKELWSIDESNLLIHLGQLIERSPVVTERPLVVESGEIFQEEVDPAVAQKFLKKGNQFFKEVSPQIDELLSSSTGDIKNHNFSHGFTWLINQKDETATVQAIIMLNALLIKSFSLSPEISKIASTLTMKRMSVGTSSAIGENSRTDMNNSAKFNQSNTGGINFQNEITGGQVNQGQNLTINNDSLSSLNTKLPANSKAQNTILFLAANPETTARLRVDKEFKEIDESLRRSQKRDLFNLENRGAVRDNDFPRAILETRPQIVHFSGHGSKEEGIVLEDNQGQVAFMSARKLDALFKLFSEENVECVLLNACYSETQAEVIHKHIPYVVGMNRSVSDKASIAFSTAFYDAIGAGRDIEFAFKLACVQLIDFDEYNIPQLLKH